MKRHFVHVYHTFRSKFAVDAETHEAAIDKARVLFSRTPHIAEGVTGMVTPRMDVSLHGQVGEGFLCAEDAEDIGAFLVDEDLDADHDATTFHDSTGKMIPADAKSLSLTTEDRVTIFAALRYWQRHGGDHTPESDKATCCGDAIGMDVARVNALMERFNK